MEIRTRNLIIWSSAFLAAFLLSLILFLVNPDRTERYVLFFPSEITREWTGEARDIYHTGDTEESVRVLLKELALGPIGLRLDETVPKGTRIRAVLLRDNTLYLDFTAHLAEPGRQLSFPEMLAGIRKTVLYNFPSIENVVIYVEGAPTDAYLEAKKIKSSLTKQKDSL